MTAPVSRTGATDREVEARRCGCGATGLCSCRDDWAPAPSCACGGPCPHDGSLTVALAEQQRLHELDPRVFPAPPTLADATAALLAEQPGGGR